MDSTDSSTASQQHQRPQLPPGFRFHPTDEELVVHYLKKKAASAPLPVSIIAEIDLYKFDPWELPAKAAFGEQEWYFFSPRERKYPNGVRPNRAATSGYWKATGTDKPVLSSSEGTQKVGVKKALVFYGGKPPKGVKTNWIMHEYRLTDNKSISKPPGYDPTHKKASLKLDEWVLCRIYKKNNPQRPVDHERYDSMGNFLATIPPSSMAVGQQNPKLQAIKATNYGALHENEHNLFEGMVGNGDINIINNSGYITSSSSNPQLPMSKRTLPSLYWNEESGGGGGGGGGGAGSESCKRFHADASDHGTVVKADENMTAMAALLSQLPQSPSSLHQQTVLDGAFRQQYQLPGLNWYSN